MQYLEPNKNKRYLDCTLGAAGHALGLLEAGATLVGIDRDLAVLNLTTKKIAERGYEQYFAPIHSSFAEALSGSGLTGEFDGILMDLGVSSIQLDTPERGFSFRFDAPLDMRMDPDNQQVTAKDLVNGLGRKELYELFTVLGEERSSRRLADTICGARRLAPIETTRQLAELIESVVPRVGHLHPATKVFQALRMAVNTEREELSRALPLAFKRLKKDGVLAVISFHSGEDRLVKSAFQSIAESGQASLLADKPITPGDTELRENPRSRSAKLRLLKKKGQS
jgi:16S rRNA (cytosine1402-N4)-methyltransferase